jgi:hypothetical protein
MRNFKREILIMISFIIFGCDRDNKNVSKTPLVFKERNLHSKFDSATYLMYKLNVQQFLVKGHDIVDTQAAQSLLNTKLFGNVRYSNDTTIFSFVLIKDADDLRKYFKLPFEYFNCFGFVEDSIKFIEVGDGATIKIDDQGLLFSDSIFLKFVSYNQSYLHNDLKRVLK